VPDCPTGLEGWATSDNHGKKKKKTRLNLPIVLSLIVFQSHVYLAVPFNTFDGAEV